MMPRRCIRAGRLPTLFVVMIGVLLPACTSVEPRSGGAEPSQLVPLESRIDALPGRTLLIPVRAAEGSPASVPVTLEDGRELSGKLWRVTVEYDPGRASWLPQAGVWRATAFDAKVAPVAADPHVSALASSMVSVDLPLNVSSRWLTVGTSRVRLNVLGSLATPGTVAPRQEIDLIGPGPAVDAPALRRLLEPERRSPVRRWRYRLLAHAASEPGDAFEDPIIEALARQEEGRWSWALRALAMADRDLAQRVARRLVATTTFGAGVVAPTWPSSQADLDALLPDLLDPTLDGARRAQRAEAFLMAQPAATAWIIDDAGTPDATTGRPSVAVGVANLSERVVLAAAVPGERITDAEPRELGPDTAMRLYVSYANEAPIDAAIGVAVGSLRATLHPMVSRVPGAPPGVALGPLIPDFTLETWIAGGSTVAPDPAWVGAAMLLRKDRVWTLFMECARAGDAAATPQEDTVRLWIGPTARPRLVLRVGESGYAHVEQALPGAGGTDAPDPAAGVTVASRAAKWVCEVKIPDWCIEPDGTLRVGLERVDSRGARSAYPRPMLPWQAEPGRIVVDTGAWGK